MHIKKNGIYYTPPALADYLAKPLLSGKNLTIFDPAYGEGSLLLAAERIIKLRNSCSEYQLFGCDIKPVNGLLKHLPEANLIKVDFFDFPVENKFNTILMNPPYVRYHFQNENRTSKYRAINKELNILRYDADLWALFVIKAVSHLHKEGNIGAILPWAFLQADYAKPLRKWLLEKFKHIKFTAFSNKYFKDADERIIVLWLEGYGSSIESIKSGVSDQISDEIELNELSIENWLSDRVAYFNAQNIGDILTKYKVEYGFKQFSEFANVKIGVVTGAVDHFVINKKKAKKYGIPKRRLIPILTKTDEFTSYLKNGIKHLNLLVALKNKDHIKYKKYIREGVERKINLRAHSQRREPWYVVKIDKTPDAFFHYRITKTPYLIPNYLNIQSTNAIHRIYFKGLTSIEKKWIYVCLLSAPSQLSIEVNSKTYGRGILKIEPKSLKNTLVVTRNDPKINPIYRTILKLLAKDKKSEAIEKATEFIQKELKINDDIISKTKKLIENYYNLRRSNKINNSPAHHNYEIND